MTSRYYVSKMARDESWQTCNFPPIDSPQTHMVTIGDHVTEERGAELPITNLSIRFTLCIIHKYQNFPGATLFGKIVQFSKHDTNIFNRISLKGCLNTFKILQVSIPAEPDQRKYLINMKRVGLVLLQNTSEITSNSNLA